MVLKHNPTAATNETYLSSTLESKPQTFGLQHYRTYPLTHPELAENSSISVKGDSQDKCYSILEGGT